MNEQKTRSELEWRKRDVKISAFNRMILISRMSELELVEAGYASSGAGIVLVHGAAMDLIKELDDEHLRKFPG